MKTSPYEEPEYVECDEGLVEPEQVVIKKVEIFHAERWDSEVESGSEWNDLASVAEEKLDEVKDWKVSQASLASSEVSVYKEQEDRWRDLVSPNDAAKQNQWKDSQVSLASSEVVQEEKWSDTLTSPPSSDVSATKDAKERWSDCRSPPEDERAREASEYYTASSEVSLSDTEREGQGKECVITGHVAAMRERFESMTRANTPAPGAESTLDAFRNITPSPDILG